VVLCDETIEAIRATLPELPEAKRERFKEQYGLGDYDAKALCDSQAMAAYFEEAANAAGDAKLAANWMLSELAAQLNANNLPLKQAPVSAQQLAQLIVRVKDNTLSNKMAKQVFDALWQGEGEVDAIIEQRGLKQVSDSGALETLVNEVVTNNPDQVAQFQATDEGKQKKLLGFFVGQIMKASKGQANPKLVNELLNKALK
jgi:aspartyl-tRNA(Asn)/glutamyl-tRNA(Gln) amidotransferase subunit B